jgi:hypothetical protein
MLLSKISLTQVKTKSNYEHHIIKNLKDNIVVRNSDFPRCFMFTNFD